MNAAGQTICLNMIVKNEAAVIRRCLDSVRRLIDYWVIVDTGSTDGTQDIIRSHLADLPGELHERPWQDFAHNRTEAMELARARADYTLIIDADDNLDIPADFTPPELTADSYTIDIVFGGTIYARQQLVRNALPWRWEGVLHEFLTCEGAGPQDALPGGVRMIINSDGARRTGGDTYRHDAAVLEAALQTEEKPFLRSRYTFYLAQSLNDCGELEQALHHYLARAEMGFWSEEVFISLYRAAQIKERLGHPEQEVIDTYLRAADASPARAEALHGASRFCRLKGRNEEGYQIGRRGIDLAQPQAAHALFIEPWIYDFGLLDEIAVNAYWSGHHKDCANACLKILERDRIPPHDRERFMRHMRIALDAAPADPNLGPNGRVRLMDQHPLGRPRDFQTHLPAAPRVLLAILAKQKEPSLPLYLDCIEALDYPKSAIVLYIRTNNNTDRTEAILRDWVARVGHLYAQVEFDAADVPERVQEFGVHEWNTTRFRVLGHIRNVSLRRTLEHNCEYYFVADVDNFVRPCTLRELVALNLPIVGPLLRSINSAHFYSNFHADIDDNGYLRDCDQYHWLLNRWVRGVNEVPVIHCTYLVRADAIPRLGYDDGSERFEYVIFSDTARQAGIAQYLDNRQVYGYVASTEGEGDQVANDMQRARALMASELRAPAAPSAAGARIFVAFGLQSSGSTWMYNLIREISRAGGEDFVSLYADSEADLPWHELGRRRIVVKSHAPAASFRAYLATSPRADIDAVLTVRDPRDSVASLMTRFGKTYEDALAEVAMSAEALAALAGARELLVFRYEDGFVGRPNTCDWIAGLLGTEITPAVRDAILAELAPDAVRETIRTLLETGALHDGTGEHEAQSQWRANHIGDGMVGKFHDILDAARQAEILERTRAFCTHFRYGSHGNDMPPTAPCPPEPAAEATDEADTPLNIHLINLDRSTDRLERFVARNSHIGPYRRFSAVDGRLVDRQLLIEDGTMDATLPYKDGTLGCALSHIAQASSFKTLSTMPAVEAKADDIPGDRNFPKTLLFCTAFARTASLWKTRYRRWLSAVQGSILHFDQIIMIDDGSPILPEWDDILVLPAESNLEPAAPVVLFHFSENLGRWPGHNYPGWYRSYAFAAEYAKRHGFEKVVHIESDAFLIGNSVAAFFNEVQDEWVALWDPYYEMPETAIQVAAGNGMDAYYKATQRQYSDYVGQVIERVLPFTRIVKTYFGGKFFQYLNYIPELADYVVQATEDYTSAHLWWLPFASQVVYSDRQLENVITESVLKEHLRPVGRNHISSIYTYHNTVVYSDETTWELRHGPVATSPANVFLVHNGKYGEIIFRSSTTNRAVAFAATHNHLYELDEDCQLNPPAFFFDLLHQGDGCVGLKSGTMFISAEANGGLSLNRTQCLGWELFRLIPGTGNLNIRAKSCHKAPAGPK